MAAVQHHHRSTTKTLNKPFKARHATKSALKNQAKGKIETLERGTRKTPHQQVMSKLDRRNQAKQHRLNRQSQREEKFSVFAGKDSAPRIVAVVPLSRDVTSDEVLRHLNKSVDVEEPGCTLPGPWQIDIPRFKQRIQYLTPSRTLIDCLDACRVADFVLFVLSANEEVDGLGEQMLRCVESQGVSTVLTGVCGLDKIEPAKKRPEVVKSLKSFITHFFASQERVHDLNSRQECSNVMRSLCTTMPKGIRWREDRSWMLVEECRLEADEVTVSGIVRGKSLKADRLVQVGDWGDFQVEKILLAPLDNKQKRSKIDTMAVDGVQSEQILEVPSDEQDVLAELAPEEVVMDDVGPATVAASERKAVLLDDHHYFDENNQDELEAPKRLPKGTSKYQAAWYLGNVSDSGSDLEDFDDDSIDEHMDDDNVAIAGPADGHFDDLMQEPSEAGAPSEYPQSQAFLDPAPEDEAEQIQAYRKQRHDDGEEHLEFPDEIELHPHVLARERLARYRGLKNLRTSAWETEEDKLHEPVDWSRLLEIADYRSAKTRVLKDTLVGGVKPGTRVKVVLRIPADKISEIETLPRPTTLFSLLKHEHKQTAVNVSINVSSDHAEPIKSKEPLIMQCGPRRLVINPMFSQAGNTPNNVHKFDRYLHPGRSAVASFIGPVIWGSVPCIFLKPSIQQSSTDAIEDLAQAMQTDRSTSQLEIIATGTTLAPSTSRVIAKRIILTGHPYKIHKRLVTVRYMFFNAEDVAYFRALQLWTRRGRSGFIKETLGTHGYFKATFDGKINPMDAVAVSLYKRVWPRQAKTWRPGQDLTVPQLVETGVA